MYRKAIITCFFFLLLPGGIIQAQSISLNYGYPYYFMQLKSYSHFADVRNDFNYVTGFSIGNYFNSSRIDVGVSYGTKNYTFNYTNPSFTEISESCEVNYYLFPLTFSQRIYSDSINTVALSLGVVFIKPFKYSTETEYNSGSIVKKENFPVLYEFGSIARFGIKYSRRISKQFFLFSETYGDYKFAMDFTDSGSSLNYADLTEDRFSVGINIGLEWIFNINESPYYRKK